MSRDTKYNYTEEEWEARINGRVETINGLGRLTKGYEFDTDYAYGGCRLVRKNTETGAKLDLSRRYYYDEDGEPDYDDMCEMLDAIIEVLKEIRDKGYEGEAKE